MELTKEALRYKLEHYRNIVCDIPVRISKIPERAKRFDEIYKEYGAQYLAKRASYRTVAKFKKDSHIDYEEFLRLNLPSDKHLKNERAYALNKSVSGVKFLAYICTDNADDAAIEITKSSLRAQTYKPVKALLGQECNMGERVRVTLSLMDNTDKVYVIRLYAGDRLNQEFFYRCARFLDNDPEADVIYTDHDVWKSDDVASATAYFKPDFSKEYLCSWYYIGPSYIIRASVWDKYEVSDDETFILKLVRDGFKFGHIHRMLFSTSRVTEPVGEEEKRKIIEQIYMQDDVAAVMITEAPAGIRHIRQIYTDNRKVSVIIPNMNHAQDLYICLKSLAVQTIINDLEIVIVENNSNLAETFAFYKWLESGEENVHLSELSLDDAVREKLEGHIKIVTWDASTEFNYSAINNFGRKSCTGEYILLLNNDVEFINPDAIEIMLSDCRRNGVGAVGAKLFYEDKTIQHAGVIIGFGGVAAHSFAGRNMFDGGYMHQADCARRVSAVTAACMMLPAFVYDEMGGLDEAYSVAFNDVDLCMRIAKSKRRIIYEPLVRGWHYESKSRGEDTKGAKLRRFAGEITRFQQEYIYDILDGDPYYNHNLSLVHNDYSYRDPYWFDKDF